MLRPDKFKRKMSCFACKLSLNSDVVSGQCLLCVLVCNGLRLSEMQLKQALGFTARAVAEILRC